MIPYWFLFSIPAFMVLFEQPRRAMQRYGAKGLLLAVLGIAMMIGLRYEVGGDWLSYIAYLYDAEQRTFTEVFTGSGDPGYILINWLANRIGGGIWTVNLACGMLFSYGLAVFARDQPRPWLALLVAVPYLVIVVAMGYSRQAVAIGLAMAGLVALTQQQSHVKFVVWIALAASFHKTAVLLIPLAAVSIHRGRVWTPIWVGLAGLAAYFIYLEESVGRLWYGYIEREYYSQGATVRVAMNALPAVLFLMLRNRFQLVSLERVFWTNAALATIGFIPLLVFLPSSAAVDRAALYFVPIQLFVLSRLPDVLGHTQPTRKLFVFLIILYSAAIQFVWLNYASHAEWWLPYQLFPL